MDTGWACPRCELVLAPSVREHRCDPPSAAVITGTPASPDPFPTSVRITSPGSETSGAVTVHVSGTVTSLDEIRRGMESRASANAMRRRYGLPA